jgi:hypothetical protein
MSDSPRRWLGLVGAAASTVVIAALFGAAWDQLPEPMATHWPLSGPPDGAMPRRVICAALAVVRWGIAFTVLLAKSQRSRATLVTLTFVIGAFLAALAWSLVTANHGAGHWLQASGIAWHHFAVMAVAAIVPGLMGSRMWRRVEGSAAETNNAPAIELKGEQRAVWLASAHNRWLWLLGVLPLLSALFTTRTSSTMGVVTSIAAIATLLLADAFSRVRVTVDRHGVRIRCGYLGLIRRSIALADITHAEVFQLAPMAHGGWGYRGSLWLMRRAAIVVRGGTALRLALASGKEFSVTVDHADDGASLINGMVRLR